jgi:hypothetical protein
MFRARAHADHLLRSDHMPTVISRVENPGIEFLKYNSTGLHIITSCKIWVGARSIFNIADGNIFLPCPLVYRGSSVVNDWCRCVSETTARVTPVHRCSAEAMGESYMSYHLAKGRVFQFL